MDSKGETTTEKKRLPGWMLIPGGPKEPNAREFRSKMTELVEKKRALITEAKELRASLAPRGEDEGTNKELEKLRQRLGEIDNQRKVEQELRFKKNEEIQKMKKIHNEHLSRLRELSDDLGEFKTLKEIDEAIAFLTRRMETSGGGLAAERRTLQQLSKLEEAKRYLVELKPLTEVIAEAKSRETLLQREWMEINDRVRHLRSEYNEQRATKQQREQEKRNTGVNRTEVYKKCDQISAQINKLGEEMNQLREEHNKAMDAWNAWREEAREKYAARIKERQQRFLERKNAEKLEEKRARALLRQNPYGTEINACCTLVQYLRDQKIMVQREEVELARQQAAAAFDPLKFLPEGAVVLNDGKKSSEPHKAAVGKKNKQMSKPKKESTMPKNRVLQHSEDKIRLFQLIGVEPPLALSAIDGHIETICAKQKEYESHIKTGELELSSDDDEEVEEEETTAERTENEEVKEVTVETTENKEVKEVTVETTEKEKVKEVTVETTEKEKVKEVTVETTEEEKDGDARLEPQNNSV